MSDETTVNVTVFGEGGFDPELPGGNVLVEYMQDRATGDVVVISGDPEAIA